MRVALLIREIALTNFRGIRDGSVTGLGEINVFAGRNNSGKSTILEALYLLRVPLGPESELGGMSALGWLLQRRARRTVPDARTLSWHYDGGDPLTISCTFDGLKMMMKAKCSENRIDFEFLDATSSLSLFKVRNAGNESYVYDYPGGGIGQNTKDPLLLLDFQKIGGQPPLLDPNFPSSCKQFLQYIQGIVLVDEQFVAQTEAIEDVFWPRILAKRVDKRLSQILNDTYGANIEHFTLSPFAIPPGPPRLPERRGHRLSAALEDFSQYIDDYGDGVRNALASLIIASQLHGTALLLEEPEIHQHPAALRLFLTALCKIAHENQLQLFITTHSLDVMNCVAQIDGTAIFHLET